MLAAVIGLGVPSLAEGATVRWFTASEPYPVYLAGRHQPVTRFGMVVVPEPTLPMAGGVRWDLAIADRVGLVELAWADGARLQLGIEFGWLGQFDVTHAWDNLGWDGLYGATITWAAPRALAVRVGLSHDSAHVGDEYMLRSHFRRQRYTREELRLGVSWAVSRVWRLYAEGGVAPWRPNEDVDRWRVQAGTELHLELADDGPSAFAAADWTLYQLDDGLGSPTVRVGLEHAPPALTLRLVLGYHGGRLPLSEFHRLPERLVSVGFEVER